MAFQSWLARVIQERYNCQRHTPLDRGVGGSHKRIAASREATADHPTQAGETEGSTPQLVKKFAAA
jgi:hypothetical protein